MLSKRVSEREIQHLNRDQVKPLDIFSVCIILGPALQYKAPVVVIWHVYK